MVQRSRAAHLPPGPQTDQRPLIDLAGWRAAEGAHARPLAEVATLQGVLTARLAAGPAGWRQRLALQEAVDLSWLAGDRVPQERLALWHHLRLRGDRDDSQDLLRAGWALRRLIDAPDPRHDLGLFLGRQPPVGAPADTGSVGVPIGRATGTLATAVEASTPAGQGALLDDKLADWHEVMGQAGDLHGITQAALSFHIWPVLDLSTGHVLGGAAPLPLIEAAVVSARLGATGHMGRLWGDGSRSDQAAGQGTLLPVGLGGTTALRLGGTPDERLARWLSGARQGLRAALRLLDQLFAWERRAKQATADLSGRTVPALITLLRDMPVISAVLAEDQIGAHRATIQRNLDICVTRGIVREITGQGRYRFWCAAL